jgi:hypothetical protein
MYRKKCKVSTKCYVILWCDILIDIAETDISVDKILFTGMEHTPFEITVGSYTTWYAPELK